MREPRRWSSGGHIALRFVGHDDGTLMGYPQIVVSNAGSNLILFQPAGTVVENRRYTDDNARAVAFGGVHRPLPPTFVPALDTVRIFPAQAGYAIELLYAFEGQANPSHLPWARPTGALRGVKINIQAPVSAHPLRRRHHRQRP